MSNRGMVLITILWIVLVIAFISFSLAAAARIELTASEDSFDSDRAFFMAKTAAEAMFRNLQKPGSMIGSPVVREDDAWVFPFESGEARVRYESNSNLIDINAASDELLASMFDSLGLEQTLRNQLVDCILDWRDIDDVPSLNGAEINDYGQVIIGDRRLPRNGPFQSLDELLLVKHMTPEIFYGRVEFDQTTRNYRRIPGVRDLITLSSGIKQINVNDASKAVLAALPKITAGSVEKIVAERSLNQFKNTDDLLTRVPELLNTPASQYLTTELGDQTGIVSVASIRSSGASRTVHLDFTRDRKKQIIIYDPLIYKDVEVINFRGWRFQ
jgi:type II secretory pathway component PulK